MDKDEIKYTKDRIKKEFYIDPFGKIIRWKGTLIEANEWTSMHALLAEKLQPKVHWSKRTDVLHDLGYIAIGSVCYGNRIKNEPTQAQVNTLCDLGYNRIFDDSGNRYNF